MLSCRARRYIQRKLAPSLSAAALLLALSGMHVPVAYAVGTTVDGTDCTLAEAITTANTDSPVAGCTTGNGDDTLYITNDITLDSALPVITSTLTIEGNGYTIQRAGGAPLFRILAVDGSGTNNGDLTLNDATITGGDTASDGGGVFNDEGTVTISNSTISGNSASEDGGGVYNRRVFDTATVNFSHSIVSGNTATGAGNEVWNDYKVTADDYNLFGDSSETDTEALHNVTLGGSDITATYGGTIPTALGDILDPLADNGGPTETHALFPGSPALDAGDPGFTPPPYYDQRGPGFPRVMGGRIDHRRV